MSNYAIEVDTVSKTYGKTKVLDAVSMTAEKGKITGLLGPNGAGKSTLIKAMTTLINFDSGSIKIADIDIASNAALARQHIGLTGQFAAVDDFLTGLETLIMVGSLYGLNKKTARNRADELLNKLDLVTDAHKLVKTYSGGMRRRLDLGASLIATPEILFLDEPTTGLDPRTRLQLWEVIRDLAAKGVTILLTTQYLEEADALCDYIYLIDNGKMLIKGTPTELKDGLGEDVIELKVKTENIKITQDIISKIMDTPCEIDPTTKRLITKTSHGSDDILKIAEALKRHNIKADELSLHRPSLDEVFLKLTHKGQDR